MMTKKLKLALATSALLVGSIAGIAAAGGSKEERAEHRAQRIAQYDVDKDGKLSEAEKQAMFDAKATERFTALDTNKDGKLSLDEFKAGRSMMMGHRHHHGGAKKP